MNDHDARCAAARSAIGEIRLPGADTQVDRATVLRSMQSGDGDPISTVTSIFF